MHVIADALTSVLAIAGLLAGKTLGWNWLDPAIGLVGSVVILKWAYNLCRETGWELLDGHAKSVDFNKVRSLLSTLDARLIDLHVWRIGPQALACEIILESSILHGADHYRSHLRNKFGLHHIVIEERRSGA